MRLTTPRLIAMMRCTTEEARLPSKYRFTDLKIDNVSILYLLWWAIAHTPLRGDPAVGRVWVVRNAMNIIVLICSFSHIYLGLIHSKNVVVTNATKYFCRVHYIFFSY